MLPPYFPYSPYSPYSPYFPLHLPLPGSQGLQLLIQLLQPSF